MTAQTVSTDADIPALRNRIDSVDSEIIRLWTERAGLSQRIGAARIAAGGTRVVLSREQQIVDKFRIALGDDGAQVAMLLLRAGRGPL